MVRLSVICLAATVLSSAVWAQLANTTSLVGTVTDSSGATISGASVTAVNQETRDTYKATTTAEGTYNIQFVRIGTYSITATQPGFSTTTHQGVKVDVNQTVRTDFTLAVGEVSQEVMVSGAAPPISTDEASVREVIEERAVADLPLNGRDPLQLAVITPGVIAGLKPSNDIPPGEDFIGAGTREIQNSISLDGISIMNNLSSQAAYQPSVDAIQEFEVQTGTYTAEYGAYLGAHLNLVTKSGTNSLHGSVFEYFRNNKLDARNYFEDPASPQVPLRQNQFGVAVGGPVYIPHLYNGKNKTFFLADYEGLRIVRSLTAFDTVLTGQERTGNFSDLPIALNGFAGNQIPSGQIAPQAQKALQYMPLPNLPGLANNYRAVYPNNTSYNQTVDRVDQNLGNNVRLFFRYAWENENLLSGATNLYNAVTSPVNTRNWVFGYTHTLTPTMVNDLRFGYQHLDTNALNYYYTHGLTSAGSDLGIPGFTADKQFGNPGIPEMDISNYMGLGNGGTNWFQSDKTWEGTDSFTITRGAHTIIAGADIRKLITGRLAVNQPLGLFTFSGDFTGNAGADFLIGRPINVTTPAPEIKNVVAEWRDGFFVTDKWQATRKLTLNLGLRYELPTVPYTENGYATILNSTQTGLIPTTVPQPGFEFINPNHKDFAPRIGAAYRLTEKTVLRAGYGIYYNPNQTNTFTFLSTNPPFSVTTTYNSSPADPTLSFSNPTPSSSAGKAGLANVKSPNPDLPTAYMHQWSFDVQRSLWSSAALDVQYLGSHSLHLDRSFYTNTPMPGPGDIQARRPNQNFAVIRIIQNDETANYNGLSVVLRQRFSHGLSLLASYTWSHDLDVSSDSNNGGAPMDPYNWKRDYGNSNWDLRHRFVASFTYELPFLKSNQHAVVRQALAGWQANGIVTVQSGMPFNVTIPNDVANTGAGNQRPNLVHAPSANCGSGHLTDCIDLTAFTEPAPYTYGDSARNMLYGPGFSNVDFSLFKTFPIHEKLRLQFRAEAFNALNTPAFANPNAGLSVAVNGAYLPGSDFGSITSTSHDNREVQLALKVVF